MMPALKRAIPLLVHQMIEAQARRTPEASAVIDGELCLTYREVERQSSELAHRLSLLGVGPDVLVGVLMKRSARCLVALLGVLRSGGAYVPFDPGYPIDRLLFMAQDAGIRVLVTEGDLHSLLTGYSGRVLSLDQDLAETGKFPAPHQKHEIAPNNLAYVLYTSGSTGRPKGIAIEHRSVAALLEWAGGVFSSEETEGVLASTSICFDLSVFEMFVPLCCGGKVIMAENALALPSLPAAEQVTLINTVPSAMTELLRMEGVPRSVRVVNLAGEPLTGRLVQQIYKLQTVKKVYNLYGPTEDTTYSTFTLVEKEDQRAPSIGRPIDNSQVYLLNPDLEPVPPGTPGELYIAGAGLARGYLLRPDMTAQKFVPDPFAAGARLYRTGDLARWREDGELEFMGRLDHQVKIRGHRIELGEIESVLSSHPGVQAVAVIGREDTPGDQRLVAYIVGKETAPLAVEELREHLAGHLPDYMLPNAFVVLKALPLTPNGKLDRAALPVPDIRLRTGSPFAPPCTPTQEMLAEIWAPILKLAAVGIRNDFFALGGHSLLGIQMLSRIRATFGVDISLARLFEVSTIESMAAFIDQAQARKDRVLSRSIEKCPRPAQIPCSFAQNGLWFFDRFSRANACYNIPAGFMIFGALDLSALQRSLNWMVKRHESLRTVFSDAGDGPAQNILSELHLTVPVIDLSSLPPALSQGRLKELAQAEACYPFDLSRGPLLRLSLIRLSKQQHLLLLVVHHIIWDDWSARVFYREFAAAYDRFAKNDEITAAPALLQYADFVVWRQNLLHGAVLEEQREYWLRHLEGIPEQSPLPTDNPRPDVERYPGDIYELEIPAGCARRAKDLTQREGATLAMLMLSVFNAVLHRYSGEEDMVVGWAVANRTRIEFEETIGFFVDTQVIRSDLSQDPTFRELLKRVKRSCMGAYEHSEMPFELLVRELNPRRSAGQNPVVQVLFTFQNTLGLVPDLPGLQVYPFEVHNGASKMDLSFDIWENADGFRCRLEYNTDLFNDRTMEKLGGHFRTVLEGVVSNPELRLSQLPLSEIERSQLLLNRQPSAKTSGQKRSERTPKNAASLSFVGPETLTEELLAEVWREVLRVEHIDVHDGFFDLGGHSLLANRVITRLGDMLRLDLPLRLIFEAPTIAQLALKVEHLLAAQIASSYPGATPESRQALLEQRLLRLDAAAQIPRRKQSGPVALSFAQQHFWLLEQLGPGNSFHHSCMGIHLKGPINAGFLEASLREILFRHEALRTVFPVHQGEPQQAIEQIEGWKMSTVDLTALSGAVRQREVERLTAQEPDRRFDLEHGPLFRAILLRYGPHDHSVLLLMHHIVFDGWSAGIMLEELAELYESLLAGREPTLPALPIQYTDFSEWQRGWLQGEILESQLSYWRSQLADLRTVELPFDRPRREVSSHRGRQLCFSISRETSAALASLGHDRGSTLFITLLAAFKTLLTRYTGAPEQVIGTPVAGRTRPETEGLIGAFINTLVLRTDLGGDPSFVELLHRVHEVAIDAYARQDVPFELLVENLQPERTLDVNPYFQVMFAQGPVAPVEKLGGATMRLFPLECHGSVLDLFMQVRETPTGLEGELIYDTDLFDHGSAARLLNCFATLLDSIVAHPHRRISELEILGPAMRHQILHEWNDTFSPEEEPLLHRRFEEQAMRTPGAIALIDGEERMTYAELLHQVRVLGSRLRSLRMGPEFLVAVLMERTTEMVVAILGVLSAGGGYVPLDPAYPADRLAYMLEDSGAKVLLTQSHLREFLPQHQAEVVLLDRGWEMGEENGPVETVSGNVAYVLYTSGSTGRPKGVAIQHSSAGKFVRWALSAFQPAELAGVLASTSLCFDLSVFEIYVPLSCGGTVILARNALALPELPAADKVTLINTVPSAMAELVALNRIPASVRTVTLCGEILHRSLADGIYARSGANRVVNLYGPTESTTYSTYIDLPRIASIEPPIGRPLEGTQVYLLDAYLAPVPLGAFGDLYLGGAGLARGYVGLPHVTAEKFLPNPFADPAGSRLYATGDIARFQPNGELEFLGRRDHQIKLRGFRIELGEIECALLRHEAVAETVATARRDEPGGMRLVAYVVPRAGFHLAADELREFLSAWLPAYSVPSAFVVLEALPRTPNGKINRNALPAPEAAQADAASFIEPSTSAELLVAQIWRDVLKIDRIGIHDHFFRVGGHSLMATRVIARLQEVLQLEMPLRSIFEAPTIARLSRKVEQLLEEQIATSNDPPVATSIKLQEQS